VAKDDRHFDDFIKNRTRHPPAVLYKYATTKCALGVLASGKLRFSSPKLFNDPFDCQWNPMWQSETPEARATLSARFRDALTSPQNWPEEIGRKEAACLEIERQQLEQLSPSERENEIAKLCEEISLASWGREDFLRRHADQVRRMRVLCLSETQNSVLMSSHYADSHRGIILGFDSGLLENHYRRPLRHVEYQPGLPEVLEVDAYHRHLLFGTSSRPLNNPKFVAA